jgi:copper homeostasis protein
VNDIKQGLEDVIDCGFNAILTSGRGQNVEEGISDLEMIQKLAKGRIEIMPGGGLRSSNLKLLQDKLEPTFYHSSAITNKTEIANPEEIKELKNFL